MQRMWSPKRVLITRQFEQSGSFVNALSAKGHYPFLMPMIETVQLCPLIEEGTYEVILFTSANAVRYFAPYNDRVRGVVYIAVGPKTAQGMETFLGVSADRIPIVHDMEHVKKLLMSIPLNGARILSPGAMERVSSDGDEELEGFGASIIKPAVYETNFAEYPKGYVDKFLVDNKIDTVTFCSPSAVKSFFKQFFLNPLDFEFISIGSTTSDYLTGIGIKSRFPDIFTVECMTEII